MSKKKKAEKAVPTPHLQKPSEILEMKQMDMVKKPKELKFVDSKPSLQITHPSKSIPKGVKTSKLLTVPYPKDSQIKCPKCSGIKIQEMENKAKVISFGVYAKKYYCKTCRLEWEFEY